MATDNNTIVEGEQVFLFEEWAEKLELNRKTIKFLRGEELTSIRTLSLIDDKDIIMMPLPLGQRKLLKAAAMELRGEMAVVVPTPTHTEQDLPVRTQGQEHQVPAQDIDLSPQASTDDVTLDTMRKAPDLLQDAGKTFDELFNEIPSEYPPIPVTKTSNSYQFDPRIILTIKATKTKVFHITDYLPEKSKKRRQARKRELVLSTEGNYQDRLVLKCDEDHPYAGIHMGEWGAANCRVMNALIAKGILSRQHVEYYLAYTAKIFEFSSKYDWENILDYDHQYRELQAEHGFLWGVTPPDMELRVLMRQNGGRQQPFAQRRFRANDANSPGHNGYNSNTNGYNNQQDCKLFKVRGYCPFGAACRYKHPKTPTQAPIQAHHGQQPAKNDLI